MRLLPVCLPFVLPILLAVVACRPDAPEQAAPTGASQGEAPAEAPGESPQDLFWGHLSALCGQAFAGAMVSRDEADQDLAGQAMTMHVRHCSEDRLEIPFHVGDNRSRTWVLTRLDDGLQLKHVHRHEDGSEDAVSLYGGRTTDMGTESAQHFPAATTPSTSSRRTASTSRRPTPGASR